jgi:methylmalonyl-CoA mutase N-terminal domain/subunit
VANTIDPLAGSYYIESLTNEIERRANLYLEKIEGMGGTLRAIEQGYIQQEIQNAAYDFQQGVDRLENVVVGVNRFQAEGEKAIPIQRIDEALESRQVERLHALRQRRDKAAWEQAIKAIEDAARTGANLMPPIIHAVESYCTVGEISDALRRVFGEYQETVVI